jgi:hypothetical protein
MADPSQDCGGQYIDFEKNAGLTYCNPRSFNLLGGVGDALKLVA